jgi:hypothetical protein
MNDHSAEEALPNQEPTEVEITSLLQQLAKHKLAPPQPTNKDK